MTINFQSVLEAHIEFSQKSPTVFRLKELQTNKEIEAHVENLKIVKERDVSLEIVPQARIPLQPPPPTRKYPNTITILNRIGRI